MFPIDLLPLSASTLAASAVEAVCEDTGVSPERSAQLQSQINVISNVVAASGVAKGAAAAGSRLGAKKAILSAGSALVARMSKSKKKGEEKIKEEMLESKKTDRVYGVYIGFKTRNMAIREVKQEDGSVKTELWDTDTNERMV